MEFTQNSIIHADLCKSKEHLFQISEAAYHLKYFQISLKDAIDHLKKYQAHVSLTSDLNNVLTHEVFNG